MIDRSRLGVAGVAGGVLMTLLMLVFMLTPRAHSYDVAGLGTYAVYADISLDLGALSSPADTDPNSGTADTAASPEPGETLAVERRQIDADIEQLDIQKRLNMSNAPGGAGLGFWTLDITVGNGGTTTNMLLYTQHFCSTLLDLLAGRVGAQVSNVTADTIILIPLDIRFRQGGYTAPVTNPPGTPCDNPV